MVHLRLAALVAAVSCTLAVLPARAPAQPVPPAASPSPPPSASPEPSSSPEPSPSPSAVPSPAPSSAPITIGRARVGIVPGTTLRLPVTGGVGRLRAAASFDGVDVQYD